MNTWIQVVEMSFNHWGLVISLRDRVMSLVILGMAPPH